MRFQLLFLLIVFLISLNSVCKPETNDPKNEILTENQKNEKDDSPVKLPDWLETAVREWVDKEGDLTQEDLNKVDTLALWNHDISDITPLLKLKKLNWIN